MTGQTIAHYRLTEKIGAGGMGEVYRATDSKLHREVAIKVIPREFARDPERMARFEREAQVLASLTHGSIAAIYGIEESEGHKAIVMELVEGEDLSTRLKRGPLPMDEAIRTGVQIAEALEAAHDRGVIHRDLKPANIKLLESGRVKLLDFGLAKALEGTGPSHLTQSDTATLSVAATRQGLVLGTAAYMSPEQATGTPADKRSDIWSLGVVIFEMLTGQRLFAGQTTSHVLADVIRAEIDFSRLPVNIPPELRALLERMLERDPRRRLRDVHDARIILDRILERGSGSHSAVTAPAVVVQPARSAGLRRGLTLALAGLAVVAIALAAAVWLRPAAVDPPQFRVTARMADTEFFRNSVGPPFDLSPDGTHIAMAIGPPTGPVRVVVRRLNELDSTTVVQAGTDISQHPYNPFFSPDGGWVGYAVSGELRKVPITGGTSLTICQVSRSRGASWGDDGTIVVAPSPDTGLFKVNAAGGEPRPLTTLNADAKEVTHRWPQVLPGSKALIFTSHTSQAGFDVATIEVVKLDTGERRVLHKGGSYGRYVPSGHLVFVAGGSLLAVPFDLERLEVTGSPVPVVQNVTANPDTGSAQFAFARTGPLVYAEGAPIFPVHPIAWVDRSGRTTTLLEEPGTYVNPRLSPDGKRLSLTVYKNRNWDIWVYDIERRVSTRLTFDDAAESEQVWSPDGRELVYAAEEPDREMTLYRKPADGSGGARRIISDVVGWPQTWSPDGRVLGLVGGGGSASHDIGILSLTTEDPKPNWILNSRFGESDPAISPDGKWLAYTSTESGAPEVYVRQFPSGGGRWQVSSGGGGIPRWARSGRELFYRTAEAIMAADIEPTGDGLRTGTPRLLFKGQFAGGPRGISIGQYIFADYDVAADGSRFVMFPKPPESGGANVGMLTLVSNWLEDLKRATASAR